MIAFITAYKISHKSIYCQNQVSISGKWILLHHFAGHGSNAHPCLLDHVINVRGRRIEASASRRQFHGEGNGKARIEGVVITGPGRHIQDEGGGAYLVLSAGGLKYGIVSCFGHLMQVVNGLRQISEME